MCDFSAYVQAFHGQKPVFFCVNKSMFCTCNSMLLYIKCTNSNWKLYPSHRFQHDTFFSFCWHSAYKVFVFVCKLNVVLLFLVCCMSSFFCSFVSCCKNRCCCMVRFDSLKWDNKRKCAYRIANVTHFVFICRFVIIVVVPTFTCLVNYEVKAVAAGCN